MSTNNPTTCTFTCSPAAKSRVLQALKEVANDSRLNEVVLSVPKGVKGMNEGDYSLTEALEVLAGESTSNNNQEVVSSILGDIHCSSLEVLERCHELLNTMAQTEWLRDSDIEIKGSNGIFIEGSYNFMNLITNMAQLTKNAFLVRMNETPHLAFLTA